MYEESNFKHVLIKAIIYLNHVTCITMCLNHVTSITVSLKEKDS